MRNMEAAFDDTVSMAEDLESSISEQIEKVRTDSASSTAMMTKELGWIDLVMEIKAMIGQSRIVLEEFVQSTDQASMDSLDKEYRETIEHFDVFMQALLKGGTIEGKAISGIDDTALYARALKLDEIHDKSFQVSAANMFEAHREYARDLERIDAVDKEADEVGRDVFGLVSQVEGKAQNVFDHSVRSANSALIIGISISMLVALGLGFSCPG